MKNLSLWEVSLSHFKIDYNDIICFTHKETSCSELYTCSHNLIVSNIGHDGLVKWNKDLSDIIMCKSKPLNVTYLSLLDTLCVGLENGELITISESGYCELAGVCNNGILAMEWSPDQELIVIVTKQYKAILMSCTYDIINEVDLFNQEFGDKQFITVGWGKKETQFHGSEGKQAAKMRNEIYADSQSDDSIKISWRGDGYLYAVGYLMEGIRRFKIFDREGHLQYSSEKLQGLGSNLSWRPSGNIIATTQKINDQHSVAFFEKNGLKHGGFSILKKSDICIEDISWSTDSEILTLQCKNIETDTQEILLFTCSNYHWYLKQSLSFDSSKKINKMLWHNDFDMSNNKKLHVFLQNGDHYSYSWIWNVDHSKGMGNDDDAVVAVIDGHKLLITGFRQTVVPPPMASTVIECDYAINSVHFAPENENGLATNTLFVITTNNDMIFFDQKNKFPLEYTLLKSINLYKNEYPFQYFNWFWMNINTFLCTTLNSHNDYNLNEYRIDNSSLKIKHSCGLPTAVLRLQADPSDSSKAFLQLTTGEIIKYHEGGSIDSIDILFPVPCQKFSVTLIDGNLIFLGLSYKNNLYLNNSLIMNGITSYFLHTDFILITTLQHMLLCTELTESGINALKEYQNNEETKGIYKRKIERGAKLIVAVPNDTRTIFQMPRGNLEAIQPRPLSLKVIGECLDTLKYHEAFDLMRKQRINLNLIYDHNPELLLKNIDKFLNSVKNHSWLSLFLSELENGDVSKSMYASSYINKKRLTETNGHNKVHMICEIMKSKLEEHTDFDNKIFPILTAFVKKNSEEDLESALTLIKNLKQKEANGTKLAVGSDEALKYLLYMVDVNRLFNVALGMYDFDLVLQVANKSQKDPKEYLPMLNELCEMDENYKKFSINKHLKRFNKAIKYLVLCGPQRYEELKNFIKYHSLYRDALDLFSVTDNIYKDISNDFGLYLRLKKLYVEAGIIYERADNIDKAIDCYKDALEWELALKLACNRWSIEAFKDICWDFINILKEEKRHNEALHILEHYYNDHDKTILYAIECGQYKTAFRLCAQYNKTELRDKFLLPAIIDDYTNLQELIQTNMCTFIKHRDRLHIVRENKRNIHDDYESHYNRDSDLYSDAGSTQASSSRGTSRSFRSSKNRRKHERKLASLKEGSQYEDVALILALNSLIISSFDLRLQVKNVNIALSCINRDKEAFILQVTLDKLLKNMKDSFKEIWSNDFLIESTNAYIAAQNVSDGCSIIPQGVATLEPHLRIAPVISDVVWKLEGLN
ncbi:hypothetical protein ACJJTC_019557 [Scirpophaga incertulas]